MQQSPRRSGFTRHDRSDRHDDDRPERGREASRGGRSEDGSRRGGEREGRGRGSTSRSRSPRRRSPSPGSPPAEEGRRAKGNGGRRGHSRSRSRSRSPVEQRSRSISRERKRSSGSKREGRERRRSSPGGRSRSRSVDDSKPRERRDSGRKTGRSSRQHGERTGARDDDRGSSRRNASPSANSQSNQQRRRSPSPSRRRRSPSPRLSNNPASRSDNSRPEFRRTRAVSSANEPAYRLFLSLPFPTLGSLLIGSNGWRAKEIKFYSGLTRLTFLAATGASATAELIGSKQAIKDGLWAIRKSIVELCKSDGIGSKCGNIDEWAGYNEDRIEDLGVSKTQVQKNSRPAAANAGYVGGNRPMPMERNRPMPMDERWNGPPRGDGGWGGAPSRDNFRPDERRPGVSAAHLNSWGSRDSRDRFAAPNYRPQRPPVPERTIVKSEQQIVDDELEALVQRPALDRSPSPVLAPPSHQDLSTNSSSAAILPSNDSSSASTTLNADELGQRVASLAPAEREVFVRRFLAASGVGIGVFALSESSEQSLLQPANTSAAVENGGGEGFARTPEAAAATLKRTASEANGSTEDSSKRLRRSEEDAGEDLDMQD